MLETAVFSSFQRRPVRAVPPPPAQAPEQQLPPAPVQPEPVRAEPPAPEALLHDPAPLPAVLDAAPHADDTVVVRAAPVHATQPAVLPPVPPVDMAAPVEPAPAPPPAPMAVAGHAPPPPAAGQIDIPGYADLVAGEIAEAVTLEGVPVSSDLLGLANPDVIALQARVQKHESVMLSAVSSGIYRPHDFRPAPWSGFAYDHVAMAQSGVVAGTRILTNRGEVEAEKLLPGDSALALRGPALLPITWIGRSHLRVPAVEIDAGALGPNMPRRRLIVGPDQLIYVDPDPVPARDLVNGQQIRQTELEFDLFHIDVGQSEVLFAEGLPIGSSSRAALQAAE